MHNQVFTRISEHSADFLLPQVIVEYKYIKINNLDNYDYTYNN